MAWFFGSEAQDFEKDIWLTPKIAVIPSEVERFAELRKSLGERLLEEAEAESVPMTTAEFPSFGLIGPNVLDGWAFPTDVGPFQSQLVEDHDSFVDIVSTGFGFGVSERIIDLIEKIEPGVHRFLPFEFLRPDGAAHPDRRWILNICSRAEVIDVERSHVQWMKPPLDFQFMDLPGDPLLFAKAAEASKRALWCEWRYTKGAYQSIASDALWEGLAEIGARGWAPKRGYPQQIVEVW